MKAGLSSNKRNSGIIVAGLMSGTSLDGLDIALCLFEEHKGLWHYEILAATTIKYNNVWRDALSGAHLLKGEELVKLDHEYGEYIGKHVYNYISQIGIKPQLIASHGHTIFHNPGSGYTYQLGHGGNIAVRTGIPVVSDFRSVDVSRSGQGAPLVPVGDKLLFADYESCLNLGGFANISFDYNGARIAFDICPVNIILNALARKLGFEYDRNGNLGKSGKLNNALLSRLNALEYYRKSPPKSLSREWIELSFLKLLDDSDVGTIDQLTTNYFHITHQIVTVLKRYKLKNTLVTGGGACNSYLINLLKTETDTEIILPPKLIIQYKEALIFACLGLLRLNNQINCYSSVTGAKADSVCGALYIP